MKRLNPSTNLPYKSGDPREDGKIFYAYTNRIKKDGFFIEMWLSKESFVKQKCIKKQNYELNKELILDKNRNYYLNNKQLVLEKKKKYKKHHQPRYAALNLIRELKKNQRTPKWLTDDQKNQIIEIYHQASLLTKQNDVQYHVDHIVPLCGKNVSGLHVPWNLQIITAKENLRKYNKLLVEHHG